MQPKISVIVPVYKAEKYLHRCVDSILAQTFTDFELILVNDGSPDNSGAICDEYAQKDNRVRVFHKENGGVSSARNLGLDNAQGEYITFCDADDYVTPDWLMAYSNAMMDNTDLAIQGYNIIDCDKNIIKHLPSQKGNTFEAKQKLIISLMRQEVYGYLWIKLFRRQLIEQNNIRFDIKSAFREDAQFFSKYLEYTTTFSCINKENYFYILPTAGKKYNGDSFYSLLPIFQSLDIIYNKELPIEICKIFYLDIKYSAIISIQDGKKLSSYHLDLYKRMSIILNNTKGIKKQLINFLILQSNNSPLFSKVLLNLFKILTK